MVMRSPSKEKALANLTSKFMSHNDQPVNFPFARMHCWSNESKFDYFSCILRPFVSSAYISKKVVDRSKLHIVTRPEVIVRKSLM